MPESGVKRSAKVIEGRFGRRVMRSGAADESVRPAFEETERDGRLDRIETVWSICKRSAGGRINGQSSPAAPGENDSPTSLRQIIDVKGFTVRRRFFAPETAAVAVIAVEHKINLLGFEAKRRLLVEDRIP